MTENPMERSLPNSSEAERAILGAIILDQGMIVEAIEALKTEDFYIPSHRRIYSAMISLFERGGEINPILIGEELKKESTLETVGGIYFITQLTFGLPHATNITHYAKVVKGMSRLRSLIKAASRITNEALECEDEPDVILEHAESLIFALREATIRGKFEKVSGLAEQLLERIQEQEGRNSVLTGLSTGYIELDRLTSGWQPSDLIILAARPSAGKTAFALMLAQNAAVAKKDAVVGIFSLEMSKAQLAMRMMAAQGNVDASRFRNGFLSRPEWTNVAKGLGTLTDMRIFVDDTPAVSVTEMRAKAMRLASEQKQIDLIIVDYMQLMSGRAKRFESRQNEVSEISRDLKAFAKELNVPLIALSQLSRKPEDRPNHRPILADLRDSGAIEQDADVVAFIYREEQYKTAEERRNMPDEKRNVAEIILAKQRSGPTDTVELRFSPSSMRFDNLYTDDQNTLPARDWHSRD